MYLRGMRRPPKARSKPPSGATNASEAEAQADRGLIPMLMRPSGHLAREEDDSSADEPEIGHAVDVLKLWNQSW
jgi:hypothetical protein